MRRTIFQIGLLAALLSAPLLPCASSLAAQNNDPRLAREYFANGEYEKAAEIYKRLHEQSRAHDYYYERYLTTLMELQDYKAADDMLKKSIKASPEKLERFVDYGNLFELQGQADKAQEQYEKALKAMPADHAQIAKLAEAFNTRKKYDYAINAYQKGEKLLKTKSAFAFELGAIYHQKGDQVSMISAYLDALDFQPSRMTNIQAFFQRAMPAESGYEELKKQLFARIQKDANNILYPEMLIWVFTQEGDYSSALRQAKALDKRMNESGMRVFRLAQTALDEQQYAAAVEGYEYISKEKGIESAYYIESREKILFARRQLLLQTANYTKTDLVGLEKEYETFLEEFGRRRSTASVMQELADFEARYLYDLNKAIAILTEVVNLPQLPPDEKDQAKLNLGDLYLMSGDPWEATLLYSQVDKDQKDSPLGELARFKNAKLSYYKGDFDWAQGQLEVLKGATSELMSNDAIELSVFILEHYALDTTATAMQLFAGADLLRFQNRDEEAIEKMDSIARAFKGHNLEDDILFAKAQIAVSRRQYTKAVEYYELIVSQYKDGILADNALFALAELYETRLNDPKKAMSLYDTIIIDYSSSLFVVESRKRFRKLRGDDIP